MAASVTEILPKIDDVVIGQVDIHHPKVGILPKIDDVVIGQVDIHHPKVGILPKIYCVNLIGSVDRRERMTQRFAAVGLDGTFIKAIKFDSSELDYYTKDCEPWYNDRDLWKRDIACMVSQFRALRAFLATDDPRAFICEDDAMFHNDFANEFAKLDREIPADCPVVAIGCMITGEFPNKKFSDHLRHIDPMTTWGAQCYLITRKWAQHAVDNFDRPMVQLIELYPDAKREWPTIRHSGGYVAIPMLAIEDCIDSVRKPADLPYHVKHFCAWDWNNFSSCDPDELSPLSVLGVERAWPHYRPILGLPSINYGSQADRDADFAEIIAMVNNK